MIISVEHDPVGNGPGVATRPGRACARAVRSEEHTSELQSRPHLVCRLLLEKKKNKSTFKPTKNKSETALTLPWQSPTTPWLFTLSIVRVENPPPPPPLRAHQCVQHSASAP